MREGIGPATPGSTPRSSAGERARERDKGLKPLRGLRLDLGSGRSWREELPEEVAYAILGGRGLGAYLLLHDRIHVVDPLTPSNPLVFAAGPLTGRGIPAAGRYSISSRSPLTGTVFDGNSGGDFGYMLRLLGLDYLVVTGACETPVYAVVGAAGARVLPAEDLWGLDVPAVLKALSTRHPGGRSAVIGRAGEHLVLFASIVNNRGRQAGRGGLGAVMGAKKVKAVVLDVGDLSSRERPPAARLRAVVNDARRALSESEITSRALPDYGTAILVNVLNEAGVLPTRNFRSSRFELAAAISGETIRDRFPQQRGGCRGCPVGCSRSIRVGDVSGGGPQYETLWALGADCGIGDLEAVAAAAFACDRAGMDTISMGATVACAMELTEVESLEGPRFGDAASLLQLVDDTAERRGLGDQLAEGSRRFADLHGRPDLAMHVKGLELPAFDPRGMTGQGLAFATSNRGACHVRANMMGPEILGVPRMIDRFATAGKARTLIELQDLNAVLDSLAMCKFTAFVLGRDFFAELLSAALDECWSSDDLRRVGERIWTLEKLFNLSSGMSRADDSLPKRLLNEPVTEGPAKGRVVSLEPMVDEYYVERGWDEEGVPRPGKLAELGLSVSGQVGLR